MRGIEAVANEHDYNLLLSTARARSEATSAFTRLLRSDVVDAAIVVETLDVQGAGPPLQPAKPWAVIGYAEGGSIPAIHADDRGGALAAAAHLLALGHRRIGVIGSVPRPSALDERLAGIGAALAAAGLALDEGLLAVGDFSFESGERAGHALLSRPDRPSAIFALNDRMALGVIRAAQSRGLGVPDDLSVVGFDDISLAALLTPALTTVRQPGFRLGEAAASSVFALLEGASPGPPTVISTELIIRGTTAPPRCP
jgi:DNA-binding LacI/PurR family transcriptional regulator